MSHETTAEVPDLISLGWAETEVRTLCAKKPATEPGKQPRLKLNIIFKKARLSP